MISKKQIIQYYDTTEFDYKLLWNLDESSALHYGYWDKNVASFPQALKRENEVLAEKAKIKTSDLVLDAGCGVGGSSIFLAERYACKVIGITLSEKQVQTAIKNAKQAGMQNYTEFLVMDFEYMSFENRKFDVVWAIESVCHAESKQQFIEEAYRILKPGGRIILADGFAKNDKLDGNEKEIMDKFLTGFGVNHLETVTSMKISFTEAGFQQLSYSDITNNVLPSSKIMYRYSLPTLLIGKVAERLKIRTKIQTGNIIAARNQYKALIKGLWEYGIFYAEKP